MSIWAKLIVPGELKIWPLVHFLTTLTFASYLPTSSGNAALFVGVVAAWELLETILSKVLSIESLQETWLNSIVSDGSMAACGWIASRYVEHSGEWDSSGALVHVFLTGLLGWCAQWAARRMQEHADLIVPLFVYTSTLIVLNQLFECTCTPNLQTIIAGAAVAVFAAFQIFKVGPFGPVFDVTFLIFFLNCTDFKSI
jgi:hypothetical protein